MSKPIVIRYVENEYGGVAVIPNPDRTAQRAAELREQAEGSKSEEERDALLQAAEQIESENRELCELVGDKVQVREIPFRPYTAGERMAASKAATSWVDGAPRLDGEEYTLALVVASTGMAREDLLALAPAILAALHEEVMQRCHPAPGKSGFLMLRGSVDS